MDRHCFDPERRNICVAKTTTKTKNTQENDQTSRMNIFGNRSVKNMIRTIDGMIGQANLSLYGTDRKSEIENLDATFYDIMKKEVDSITNVKSSDTTSFLSKLVANDRKDEISVSKFVDSMNGIGSGFGTSDTSVTAMNSFLETVYRNRLMEQSDLHQVSSQLIELQEAILVTRDAIISADVVEGRMNRTISFDGIDESNDDYIPIVEQVEKSFGLLEKIKSFIVPFTLEYGNYYVYTIPYSKLFSDFMRNKDRISNNIGGIKNIGESTTILESTIEFYKKEHPKNTRSTETFLDEMFDHFMESTDKDYAKASSATKKHEYAELKKSYTEDVSQLMNRIEVCNDPDMAIPFLEEGFNSFEEFTEIYMEASDTGKRVPRFNPNRPTNKKKNLNPFEVIQQTGSVDGAYRADGGKTDIEDDFSNIKDVFIRMVDPTKIIPIEIMDETIGYYLVYAEETTKLQGLVSSDLGYQGVYGSAATSTFIDDLCDKIIRSFNKKFLEENVKFKRLIVQAVNYYNLSQNRIKFQYVPVEYIQEFKVDEDINGHGQSIVKKSLFYAKMYLMLLMFKLLSLVTSAIFN